jgi:hypothetical protein
VLPEQSQAALGRQLKLEVLQVSGSVFAGGGYASTCKPADRAERNRWLQG